MVYKFIMSIETTHERKVKTPNSSKDPLSIYFLDKGECSQFGVEQMTWAMDECEPPE